MVFLAEPYYFKPIFSFIRSVVSFTFHIPAYFAWFSQKAAISYSIFHIIYGFMLIRISIFPFKMSIMSYGFSLCRIHPLFIGLLAHFAMSILLTTFIKASFTPRKWYIISFVPIKFRKWLKNIAFCANSFFFCIVKFLHILIICKIKEFVYHFEMD